MRRALLTTVALIMLTLPSAASADKASHKLWPVIDMLLINKNDGDRPLDARPGMDPFGGQDSAYQCIAGSNGGSCLKFLTSNPDGSGGMVVKPDARIHAELLGGHGNDTITGGDLEDVMWGDSKGSGQPASQHDTITGGAARDHIYVSHGTNTIVAGGGNDRIHAHFGKGTIDCGPGKDIVFVSHATVKLYKRTGCEQISYMLNAD